MNASILDPLRFRPSVKQQDQSRNYHDTRQPQSNCETFSTSSQGRSKARLPTARGSSSSSSDVAKSLVSSHHSQGFECPYDNCDKVYRCQSSVLRHKKQHEGCTYVCDCCSKKFTRKDNLKVHERKHHSSRQMIE